MVYDGDDALFTHKAGGVTPPLRISRGTCVYHNRLLIPSMTVFPKAARKKSPADKIYG